jgi:hypothetical protein
MTAEPPVYRPFALAAFAATLGGGTPLGIWLASWLYLGAAAVPIDWALLHPHLQIFGFFGMLIPGVAHHLLARFTGRAVTPGPLTAWIFGLLVSGLVSSVWGTWMERPGFMVVASCLGTAGFGLFGVQVWRLLEAPPLALLRRQLSVSTGWLALACLLEAWLRWHALGAGLTLPDIGGLRAVHAMALLGGVVGWVVGVLLRAGPMFVPGWRVPDGSARAFPWALGLGVSITVAGEMVGWTPSAGAAPQRLGESVALGSVGAILLMGGARRGRRPLRLAGQSAPDARIFRLAAFSAGLAAIGSAVATALAWSGAQVHQLTDVVRHLVTVGFLTSVVVAMAFRLIPVLEGTRLPWPRLREVAFWALVIAVVLRSGELFVGHGWEARAPGVPLSGVLVWIALACVAANLVRIIRTRSTARPSGTP